MLSTAFKTLSQTHLDISFAVSPLQQVRIVEAPGLWMAPGELRTFLNQLREVAEKTLPTGKLEYGVLSGDKSRLDNSIVTLVTEKSDGTPVAFNALARIDVDLGHRREAVLHLGLVMVDPQQRSHGLSRVLKGLT